MNTLQTIYNKLQDKTELAKHEVNLASLDEYNRLVFGDQTWVDELTKTISYIDRYVDGGLFVVKEGLKSITKTLEYEKKIDVLIKELGVQPSPEYIKNKEKIRIIQKKVNEFSTKLNLLNK